MLNLQVDDLDGLLDRLQAEGVTVDPERQSYDFGKFGWITDPAGNRIELWEPATSASKELPSFYLLRKLHSLRQSAQAS